eukprot:TRINITY_DN5527_c0_g1_i1.p1 TRINITY_DN5527_c0_g1~~TRINITY_DN5527_c0_g1_i1.p1  ORF type:complete len:510 (-),score=49.37 TRINITY_DN5527_c0_g1_i1:18-1523(-)
MSWADHPRHSGSRPIRDEFRTARQEQREYHPRHRGLLNGTNRAESRVLSDSPLVDASCRVACFPLTTRLREYGELRCRYPKLHIPNDLVRVTSHWLDTSVSLGSVAKGCEFDVSGTHVFQDRPSVVVQGCKFNVRVMLLCQGEQGGHPHHRIKFLVGRNSSGLTPLGGSWNDHLDGDDYLSDETIHRTAVRTVQEACGIDLGSVTNWHRWLELEYDRPDEGAERPAIRERTLFLIPDVWSNPPPAPLHVCQQVGTGFEEWEAANPRPTDAEDARVWAGQRADALRAHQQTVFLPVSLGGLLDYVAADISERTAEISLFAESCAESLQLEFGRTIWAGLSLARRSGEPPAKRLASEPRTKESAARRRLREQYASRDNKELLGLVKEQYGVHLPAMRHLDLVKWIVDRELEGVDEGTPEPEEQAEEQAKNEPQPQEFPRVAAAEVQRAFEYFDNRRTGFVRAADLEQLLYNITAGLPRRAVHPEVLRLRSPNDTVEYTSLEFD